MNDSMQDEKKSVLLENLQMLEQSAEQLRYSLLKCKTLAPPFSPENLESIEALSARFARTADILTQKVVRSLLLYLREDSGTFIDTANHMEKMRLADSAQSILEIRDLRNEIVHDYGHRDSKEVKDACSALAPALLDAIARTKEYIAAL